MDFARFRKILISFADTPADLDLSKGQFVLQLRDELIEGSVAQREGTVWVTESDTAFPAHTWIVNRVARLPLLAERLISFVPDEMYFVGPSGKILESPNNKPDEIWVPTQNALDGARELLNLRPAGVCSVAYITSDAGEGKTTLMNQ